MSSKDKTLLFSVRIKRKLRIRYRHQLQLNILRHQLNESNTQPDNGGGSDCQPWFLNESKSVFKNIRVRQKFLDYLESASKR